MDACLQVAIAAKARGAPRNLTQVFVPTRLEEVDVFPASEGVVSTEAWARHDEETLDVVGTVNGEVAIRIRAANITSLGDNDRAPLNPRHACYCKIAMVPRL